MVYEETHIPPGDAHAWSRQHGAPAPGHDADLVAGIRKLRDAVAAFSDAGVRPLLLRLAYAKAARAIAETAHLDPVPGTRHLPGWDTRSLNPDLRG